MKNIIFIAPPAAGKGTQSQLLKDKFNYNHLSTGDILREEIASGSEFGLYVKNIIDSGKLVSDDIIVKLIEDKLTNLEGKPFILDGFPRTLNQAIALDNIITDSYEVVYLEIDEESAINRILGRLTCSCGKSYNVNIENLKPKVGGICDNCGNKLVKRNDDNVEAFKVRYETFIENTKPLVDYYNSKNILHIVDVNRSVDDIFMDIESVIHD